MNVDDGDLIDQLVADGNEAAELGDHATAIDLFARAVELGDESFCLNLGNSYAALGQFDDALRAFERGWAAGDVENGENLLIFLEEDGQTKRLRPLYQELASAGSTKAVAVYAQYLYSTGEPAEAKRLARIAMDDTSELGDSAAGMLGHWEYREGNAAAAEPLLRRGESVWEDARTDLACLLLERGEVAEAVLRFEASIAAGDGDSAIPYANYLEDVGDVDRAEAVLRQASDRGQIQASWNLYVLLFKQERDEEAEPYLWLAADGGDQLAQKYLVEAED